MTYQFFLDKKPHNGLTYEAYIQMMEEHSRDRSNEYFEIVKLNLQRTNRINKTYKVTSELKELVSEIKFPQLWMVITEDWCGDSAQNLPYLAKIASCNSLIAFRIILRDQNLDIMDLYLTDSKSRSIPKLVVFNEAGTELIQWGPRPHEAQELIKKAKADGKSKEDYIQELHLWYGRNHGKNLENEFKEIIKQLIEK